MKIKTISINKNFIGRRFELDQLSKIAHAHEASILVVYGRRRVGKTELMEQAFRDRNLLKFEGIEGQTEKFQMKHVLRQFSEYRQDPLLSKLQLESWTEIFQLIAKATAKGKWTIFLDELQWLASYKDQLVSELKFVWDNHFRYNPELILILCGSSPSFIVNKVLHSKSLYNRSQHEMPLSEFSLKESRDFLGKNRSAREVMDAYLTVGGIPEYLKYLKRESSVFLGLCKNSFISGSFFSNEYQRIFTSSLGADKSYSKIVSFLSRRKFATRADIAKHISADSGGHLTSLLKNLEVCGFITRHTPFNLGEKSLLARYNISDQYLQFYFKFVDPIHQEIQNGDFNHHPTKPINTDTYQKWLGFGFERFCRKHHTLFARLLGFESVVYRTGTFFNRKTNMENEGFQMDLVFERADKVYTLCEIKYLQSQVTRQVIPKFEHKLKLFANPGNKTIHKVLISAEGADSQLTNSGYFDRILTLKDILS